AEENGRLPGEAENLCAKIGFRNIYEPPRAELEVLKSLAVELQGAIVIHAAEQVAQMRGRQQSAGERLEIAHTQRVGGAIDGWRTLLCPGLACQGGSQRA